MSETSYQPYELIEISFENFKNFEEPPVKTYTEDKLKEMSENIKKRGLPTPIIAHPIPNEENKYKVVAGHDIFIAAKEAGLKTIMALIQKKPAEDKMKIFNEKLEKAKKNIHNLNSYTDDVYKLSKNIKYETDTEGHLEDQLKSKYEKLRNLTKEILGKEGIKNLEFLKSREILTMFLTNLVNHDNLYKNLIKDIKTNIEQISSKNSLIRDFIANFFIENAILTEKQFGDSTIEIPQKYTQEYKTLNGKNLKEDFIKSTAKKLEIKLFKLFGLRVNIDPHCEIKTEEWLRNINIDLRKIYFDSLALFKLIEKSYRPQDFLDNSIKDNYLNMTQLGIITHFFNVEREIVLKKPTIELTLGIEDKTVDWLKNKFGVDLRSIYPKATHITELFENGEEFETFLEKKVKDNYENAKIHDEITNMIKNRLGMPNVRIDPLCEDNTEEWVKKNLHVDLRELKIILDFFETESGLDDFLNNSVRDNLEDILKKDYGFNLDSWFNMMFDNTMNLVKIHFDSIKEIENINLKLIIMMIYNEIYTSSMPLINTFQETVLITTGLQKIQIQLSHEQIYEKIKNLLSEIRHTAYKPETLLEEFDFNMLSNKQLELIEGIIKNQDKFKVMSYKQFIPILIQLDSAILENNFPETLESILKDI